MRRDYLQRALAEFVGTFALVFVAAGSVMSLAFGSGLVGVALAQGLVLAVMVSAVGHISGGHFNPAITLGFLLTRRIEPILGLIYWATQLVAGIAAAGLLWLLFPEQLTDGFHLGAPSLGGATAQGQEGIGQAAGFGIEATLTFFLAWAFFATVADPRGTFKSIAGLAIGLTLAAALLVGGALTGGVLNPARALGPQLIGNEWTWDFWVWYVGPLTGGALAALVYEFVYLRPLGPKPVGPPETGLEEPRPGETAAS